MRVLVLSGDRKTYLGKGDHVGDVTTWFWTLRGDGLLMRLAECEQEPSVEIKAKMDAIGYELLLINNNPKIVLDGGEVVYGCQVWWTPVEEQSQNDDPQ